MLFMLLGMISLVAMIMVINEVWMLAWIGELELSIGTVIISFGALIWFSQSIKCPLCKYKPVWPILKSALANEWLARITKLEECPFCKR